MIKETVLTPQEIGHWLGTDTNMQELLAELANGEYEQEQFKQDIIDTWQQENEDE